jgi:AmmeMemoRadiSam system protein A/AmmeMemoRadiSam system protein B
MTVLNAVAVPHPPLIFPEVGKGKEQEIQRTIDAYRKAMRFLADGKPDTIVIISPHMRWYSNYFHVESAPVIKDKFVQFGAPQVEMTATADAEFVNALDKLCRAHNFPAGTLGEQEHNIDHGSFIPMRFLSEVMADYKVVRIAISGLSVLHHYLLGHIINEVSAKLGRKTAIIASGDLSHRLLAEGPYGFTKEGPEFDKKITEVLDKADFLQMMQMEPELCEAAGECGYRPFVIMGGAFDARDVKSELLSYEGPFGVGYGVATFAAAGENKERNFKEQYVSWHQQKLAEQRAAEDEYVRLARKCVETYVLSGRPAILPADLPAEMLQNRAGAFVSMKIHKQLRGCIGTIAPVYENIAEEIAHNAISSCSRDPRFVPVRPEELEDITYSVDILNPAEPIASEEELDVKKYGVIVECADGRRGLLLPDIEGVDTVEQQVAIARQKGNIAPHEKVQLYRFEVVRHY